MADGDIDEFGECTGSLHPRRPRADDEGPPSTGITVRTVGVGCLQRQEHLVTHSTGVVERVERQGMLGDTRYTE